MRFEWLAIGITLAITFSTFGYPLLFDRLLLGLLIVTALVSFKWDKNLFALCLIFVLGLLIEELAWLLSEGNRYLIVPSYLYLLIACFLTRYSLIGKLSIVFAIAAITAEIYWLSISKVGPRIFWYAFVCANLLVVKHLVLIRPHFCTIKFPYFHKDWNITKTDVDIGYAIGIRIMLEFLMMGEYLIRHVLQYQVLVVYDSYSIAAHTLIGVMFYLFLRAFSETLKAKIFSA